MPKPTIEYTYRGNVERGRPRKTARGWRPSYRWFAGYSESTADGAESQPGMTYRECQADARARGARAVFVKG